MEQRSDRAVPRELLRDVSLGGPEHDEVVPAASGLGPDLRRGIALAQERRGRHTQGLERAHARREVALDLTARRGVVGTYDAHDGRRRAEVTGETPGEADPDLALLAGRGADEDARGRLSTRRNEQEVVGPVGEESRGDPADVARPHTDDDEVRELALGLEGDGGLELLGVAADLER